MKSWTLAIAAASVAVTGMASPAMAEDIVKKVENVSYAGLDLNTAEGQAILDRRIKNAAREVCDYYSGRPGTAERREGKQCTAKAIASARTQVAEAIEDQRRGG